MTSSSSRFRQRVLRLLRRRWWLVVILVAAACAGQTLWEKHRQPVYASTAYMWVSGQIQLPEGNIFREDVNHFYGNQIALLGSERLVNLAHARVQEALPGVTPIPVKLSIKQRRSTSIFVLEARGTNPAYLQPFLNALMEEYLKAKQKLRAGSSEEQLALVNLQLAQFERELKVEEEKLAAFSKTNNDLVLQAQSSIDGNYLARLKTQLADLKLEARMLEITASNHLFAPTSVTNTVPSVLPGVLGNSSELASARLQLDLLKNEQRELSQTHRPQHPKMIKLQEQIDKQEKLVQSMIEQGYEQIRARQRELADKMASVAAAIAQYEQKVRDNNARLAELAQLKANVARARERYEHMQAVAQKLDVGKSLDKESVSILERASPPVVVKQNPIAAYALAVMVGLALSLGLVSLEAVVNDKVRSPDDLVSVFSERIVAQVPRSRVARKKRLVRLGDAQGKGLLFAEAFRNIRSFLFYMLPGGERPRTVLVTSAIPGEGKSVVAAQLAQTLAAVGSRVVLVDADLRGGRLHRTLGVDPQAGLSELLRGEVGLDDVLLETPFENVQFIAIGKVTQEVPERLVSEVADRVLHQLAERFDFVVIDSPPVLVADDAVSLAPKTDGVLFVVRNLYTRTSVVQHALDLLYQRQGRVIGFVLNCAEVSRKHYSYYHQYYGRKLLKAPSAA